MKIFTTTTTTDSRLMLAGVLTATLLGVGYVWDAQRAVFTLSKDFAPMTEDDEATVACAVVDVDDVDEEEEEKVEAEEEKEEAKEEEEEKKLVEEEEEEEQAAPAAAAAVDEADLALAMELSGVSWSYVMAMAMDAEIGEAIGVEPERETEMQVEVEAAGTPKVDTETKTVTDKKPEPAVDAEETEKEEMVETEAVAKGDEEEEEEVEAEEPEEAEETTPLVERRVVVFRPLTAVDNNESSSAPTMAVSARFADTSRAIRDLYVNVTELTVAGYYFRLTAKYEAVVADYYCALKKDKKKAAGVSKKQYPLVFVEDYQTGDNCVFVPQSQIDEMVGLDAMVCEGMIKPEQVPRHLRVDHVFRGVRQRGRGPGARFTPTPLEPMDPEMLCLVRGVPFSRAVAAAEAAKPKADEARFEERLVARELAEKMQLEAEWQQKMALKAQEEREREQLEMTLMGEEDAPSQLLADQVRVEIHDQAATEQKAPTEESAKTH